MTGTHLAEFEELVLLVVGILTNEAYAVNVAYEIQLQTKRKVTLSPDTVHFTG